MEMRIIYLFIVVVVLVCSTRFSTAGYQTPEPHTVLDYYKLLPQKYFEANEEQRVKWMLDPRRGAIVDVKNGYIFAPGDGAQTDVYVCLFKKSDRSYVIAVTSHPSDTNESTRLDLYLFDRGTLLDVTKRMLPVAVDEELKYELPRYGRTIHVKKKGRRIYDLIWAADKFTLKKI
jgi:hypothetical protein